MKIYKLVFLVIVLVGVAYLMGSRLDKVNLEEKQIVTSSKSELEKIMDEENFKKITVLRARKVANDSKKAIEVERNKQAMSAIEGEFEAIRAEELLLVGKDLNLK